MYTSTHCQCGLLPILLNSLCVYDKYDWNVTVLVCFVLSLSVMLLSVCHLCWLWLWNHALCNQHKCSLAYVSWNWSSCPFPYCGKICIAVNLWLNCLMWRKTCVNFALSFCCCADNIWSHWGFHTSWQMLTQKDKLSLEWVHPWKYSYKK